MAGAAAIKSEKWHKKGKLDQFLVGLAWRQLHKKPHTGHEVKNEALCAALTSGKLTFAHEELDSFGPFNYEEMDKASGELVWTGEVDWVELPNDCFITAGGQLFTPDESGYEKKHHEQEVRQASGSKKRGSLLFMLGIGSSPPGSDRKGSPVGSDRKGSPVEAVSV